MRPTLFPFSRVLLTAALAVGVTACGSGISLDEPIEGPVWWLTQLNDEPVPTGREPQNSPQVTFDRSSGRVSGSGGCNRMSGSFTRGGGSLRVGQLAATKMACADLARNETEAQFFQALQTTTSYRLAGPGRLALLDARGHTIALLNTAPPR